MFTAVKLVPSASCLRVCGRSTFTHTETRSAGDEFAPLLSLCVRGKFEKYLNLAFIPSTLQKPPVHQDGLPTYISLRFIIARDQENCSNFMIFEL